MIPNLLILDNFYNDLEFVVNCMPEITDGVGCGGQYNSRSGMIEEENKHFYNMFSETLCQLYNLDKQKVVISTFINKQSYSPIQILNEGMIHIDGRNSSTGEVSEFNSYRNIISGMIILSDNLNSSKNFYVDITTQSDSDKFKKSIRSCYDSKVKLLNDEITTTQYEQIINKYNSDFKLDSSVSLIKNRFISWKCGIPHCTKLRNNELVAQMFNISVV